MDRKRVRGREKEKGKKKKRIKTSDLGQFDNFELFYIMIRKA